MNSHASTAPRFPLPDRNDGAVGTAGTPGVIALDGGTRCAVARGGVALEIAQLSKGFDGVAVLRDVSLTVPAGQCVAILGRSGCGKSTLLRLIARLERPDAGTLLLDGEPIAGTLPRLRMMFQDARLLPWFSVLDNVGLGLRRPWKDRAHAALAEVGLSQHAAKWPAQLSGGQRQRVALARALIHQPQLLLLDEPLGALDALTRIEMQALIEDIRARHGFTVLLVTHDAAEAVALGDRVLVIERGAIAHDLDVALPRPRARTLRDLGYSRICRLDGGLEGWEAAGGELFIDVNVPSKAFGELVEARRRTPLLDAETVKRLLDDGADAVVVDARRFDEYQTMTIPGSISVPGAELVLRIGAIAPDPATTVIVNCAGRTRSIIGTQSLINAGVPNRVVGLRNGTIGWTLAGQRLEHGADRTFPPVDEETRGKARKAARDIAERTGARRVAPDAVDGLQEAGRTVYRFDVRPAEEFESGHLPGFANRPGGQLVQETDHAAPVRGARIVLADDDGVRADMTASWLAQMGWEVFVVEPVPAHRRSARGPQPAVRPTAAAVGTITPQRLSALLADGGPHPVAVLDVTASANYVRQHIPGAWFALRSQLAQALERIGVVDRYVLTCGSSLLARFAAADLTALTDRPVQVLVGGTAAWLDAGLPSETGETRLASPRIDRYRRPYEGTQASATAMQAYLEWEYGLVAQLDRDGTHNFSVL